MLFKQFCYDLVSIKKINPKTIIPSIHIEKIEDD